MKIEKLDILTLDDGDYIVLEILEEDDKTYYYLNEIDEEENLKDKVIIAYYAKGDHKEGLALVEDEKLDELKTIFISMLQLDYNKE